MEQMQKSLTYMNGLLGNTARKNVEQIALGLKEKVRSLQYFSKAADFHLRKPAA